MNDIIFYAKNKHTWVLQVKFIIGFDNNNQKRKGNTFMSNRILCSVRNCQYWDDGNICGADQIYVISTTGETAEHSRQTDCKTFKPSNR